MATTDPVTGQQIVQIGAASAAAGSSGIIPTVSSATVNAGVASAATSVTIVAANAARRGLLLVNTDANILRIKYGATATASSFTVPIPSGGYWEMPQPIYLGIIDGIWDADGSGSAFVTEL